MSLTRNKSCIRMTLPGMSSPCVVCGSLHHYPCHPLSCFPRDPEQLRVNVTVSVSLIAPTTHRVHVGSLGAEERHLSCLEEPPLFCARWRSRWRTDLCTGRAARAGCLGRAQRGNRNRNHSTGRSQESAAEGSVWKKGQSGGLKAGLGEDTGCSLL